MATSEQQRFELFERLSGEIGEEASRVVFELARPDVATSDDIAALHGEFARLHERFAEVDARFAEVDTRFDRVDARFDRVDERFDELEQRVDIKLDSLRYELQASFQSGINAALVSQTRTIIFAIVTVLLGVAGLAFAMG